MNNHHIIAPVHFYELPLDRVEDVRKAAMGIWRPRRALREILETLREPHPPIAQTPEVYLSAALGVVGDAPLPSGAGMLGDDSGYSDLLLDLNEGVGGGWEVIDPSPERLAALDPSGFDVERLRDHYSGGVDYFEDPDGDDDDESAGRIDDPEDFPADAGEQIQQALGVLRDALAAVNEGCVLLIRD